MPHKSRKNIFKQTSEIFAFIFAVQLKIETSYHTKPNTFRTRWHYIIFSIRHEMLNV